MRGSLGRLGALLGLALVLSPAMARASEASTADYPSRPIRVIVPYTPGGIADTVTRIVSAALSPRLGETVVVENKPGANSIIGAEAVAKSPPDGYTLGMVIGAHAANATFYGDKLPFDPMASFTPVTLVGTAPLVMAASTKLPVHSLADLIAYAKAHPGEVRFGSSGVGAAAHLTTEFFKRRVGVEMEHVPYKGAAQALSALVAGEIDLLVDTVLTFKPHIASGGITALAIAASTRSPAEPGIPTFAEAGVPDFNASTWTLLLAPAGTPSAIVDRLSSEVANTVREPATRGKLSDLGVEPVGDTPREAREFLAAEIAKWGAIIREANVKLEF
jgi:tripartite-type tricarboxylate transporter receptor subunit TctC